MNFKNILTRSISGLVYVALIVGCILIGETAVICLAIAFATIAVIEFTKITKGLSIDRIPTLLSDIASVCCLVLATFGFPIYLLIFSTVFRLVIELYSNEDDPLRSLAYSFMAYIYIGLPFAMMIAMAMEISCHILLALFIFIWLNDTGAFIFGCAFGKHKLFERISPKKTWEGFFGGFLLTCAASVLFGLAWPQWFGFPGNVWWWIGLGASCSVFATFGDLIESMIKRNLHIKDSGNLIPGHGGILDRIDSLLLVLPVAFLYIFIFTIIYF